MGVTCDFCKTDTETKRYVANGRALRICPKCVQDNNDGGRATPRRLSWSNRKLFDEAIHHGETIHTHGSCSHPRCKRAAREAQR